MDDVLKQFGFNISQFSPKLQRKALGIDERLNVLRIPVILGFGRRVGCKVGPCE